LYFSRVPRSIEHWRRLSEQTARAWPLAALLDRAREQAANREAAPSAPAPDQHRRRCRPGSAGPEAPG
jgi:hypothetical protein